MEIPFGIFLQDFIHELLTILFSKSVYPSDLGGNGRWYYMRPPSVCSPSAGCPAPFPGLREMLRQQEKAELPGRGCGV